MHHLRPSPTTTKRKSTASASNRFVTPVQLWLPPLVAIAVAQRRWPLRCSRATGRRLHLNAQEPAVVHLGDQVDVGAVAERSPDQRSLRREPLDGRGFAEVALPPPVDQSFERDV
jgi:hypothetical protein